MPELPDVEVFKRYLDSTSLHHRITDVQIQSSQVLGDVSEQDLRADLKGHEFECTKRHGKYLFTGLDSGRWLVLHFGMTGNPKYFKDMDQEPQYDRLLFSFANGYHLAYQSRRKLGEVALLDDLQAFVEGKELGPDVLDESFDLQAFKKVLQGHRGMVKSALMNQQLMAGIGNVYSDEILFQAGIHPRTKVNQLDDEQLGEIFKGMKEVLNMAIDRQADPQQFPDTYIIPHRHQGGTCPCCGAEVRRVKVSGRSAYYCPNRQGEP